MTKIDKPIKPNNRTKVGTGTALFAEGDGRSLWGRRFREIVAAHVADLGRPAEHLSEAQRSLIRRVSTFEIELEKLEGRMSMGDDVDLDLYSRVSGQLRRILESLGIERRQVDMTPSLADIIGQSK